MDDRWARHGTFFIRHRNRFSWLRYLPFCTEAATYFPTLSVSSLTIPAYETMTYGLDGVGKLSIAMEGTTAIVARGNVRPSRWSYRHRPGAEGVTPTTQDFQNISLPSLSRLTRGGLEWPNISKSWDEISGMIVRA
jgi:hypothetical protein